MTPPRRAPRKATAWEKLRAQKAGRPAFTLITLAASSTAPISGKACAVWKVFFEGAADQGSTRVYFDEFPREEAMLLIDGAEIAVPHTQFTIKPSSAKAQYQLRDAHLPPSVERMFKAAKWVDSMESPPPKSASGDEYCLAPSTSYRGTVTSKQERIPESGIQTALGGGSPAAEAFTTSYELVIESIP